MSQSGLDDSVASIISEVYEKYHKVILDHMDTTGDNSAPLLSAIVHNGTLSINLRYYNFRSTFPY
jgi:hypothetical protein